MASVAAVVARWLDCLVHDQELLDRMERTHSSRYQPQLTTVGQADRCCCPCNCTAECSTEERSGLGTDKGAVLTGLVYRCGCREEVYTVAGRRVGGSQRRYCDGAVETRQYRAGCLQGFSRALGGPGALASAGWWEAGVK